MILVADSGAIYALYDGEDRHHSRARAVLSRHRGPIVIPTVILAEIDYLLREFLGIEAELDFLDSLREGAFELEPLNSSDLDRARQLIAQYRGLDLGLADAVVMATAERLGTLMIFTVDERDFRAVSKEGRAFSLFPADLEP